MPGISLPDRKFRAVPGRAIIVMILLPVCLRIWGMEAEGRLFGGCRGAKPPTDFASRLGPQPRLLILPILPIRWTVFIQGTMSALLALCLNIWSMQSAAKENYGWTLSHTN